MGDERGDERVGRAEKEARSEREEVRWVMRVELTDGVVERKDVLLLRDWFGGGEGVWLN